MRKEARAALRLSREVVRELTGPELRGAAAGAPPTQWGNVCTGDGCVVYGITKMIQTTSSICN